MKRIVRFLFLALCVFMLTFVCSAGAVDLHESEPTALFEDSGIYLDTKSDNSGLSCTLNMQDIQAEIKKEAESSATEEIGPDFSVEQNVAYDENGILRTMPCEFKYTKRSSVNSYLGVTGYAVVQMTIRGTVDVQNGTVLTLEPIEIDIVSSQNTARNGLKIRRQRCTKSNTKITYDVEGSVTFEGYDEDGNFHTEQKEFPPLEGEFEAQDFIV